jgi:hypothetical protein
MNDRYAGKPLLRLLDAYTLWCIGELPEPERQGLEKMTPDLQRVYQMRGTWVEIVSRIMDVPDGFPEQVRGLWAKTRSNAEAAGQTVSPVVFATLFVDRNLGPNSG